MLKISEIIIIMIIVIPLYCFLFAGINDKKLSGGLFAGYMFNQFVYLMRHLAAFCLRSYLML